MDSASETLHSRGAVVSVEFGETHPRGAKTDDDTFSIRVSHLDRPSSARVRDTRDAEAILVPSEPWDNAFTPENAEVSVDHLHSYASNLNFGPNSSPRFQTGKPECGQCGGFHGSRRPTAKNGIAVEFVHDAQRWKEVKVHSKITGDGFSLVDITAPCSPDNPSASGHNFFFERRDGKAAPRDESPAEPLSATRSRCGTLTQSVS